MKKNCFNACEILLPSGNDYKSWSCIACDQFTSEVKYWQDLEKEVAGKKSVLNLIFPEVYLEDNKEERIAKINANIEEYITSGAFKTLKKGLILTVRKTPYVERRIGIIGAIDLDSYEYSPKSKALVRSTEGVVEERIPPRLEIRKNARVEFPHVMMLFDDERKEIAEELYKNKDRLEKLYDFELNMGGGSIEGYFIEDYQPVLDKFEKLLDEERLTVKYGKSDKFAFAVGDGNHSLATAKAHWEAVKKTIPESEWETCPAKYALVEANNIYDDGIYFEPIFRHVSGVNAKDFTEYLLNISGNFGVISDEIKEKKDGVSLPQSIINVDTAIKEYITKNGGKVDYIHGLTNLNDLIKADKNSVGITFDKLDKKELFNYVSNTGAFPRKTFSMGEGVEKRYYLEGRLIKK